MDIIGPFAQDRAQMKYAIAVMNYFVKWVESKQLVTIIEAKTIGFIWKLLLYEFGIPHAIITNNGKQFDSDHY